MKRNPFSLPLLISFVVLTSMTYGQENSYIVSKYDFIPGEKVIFFDDFSSENIGDFPAQWLTNGSGEIVTSDKFPGKWFHLTKGGYYIPEAKEDFTENFTIEFDFIPMTTDNNETIYSISFYLLTGKLSEPGGGGEPGDAGFQLSLDYDNLGWKNWSIESEQRFNGIVTFPFKSKEKYHIAIWVQKQRVRFYANETKVLDVPRAIPTGSKPNIFRFDSRDEAIPLISNFRIAAGLPDMRNRLLKDGKIISYGIQFDVNSDKLKPESYSTLKEISDILKENPAIRILVVGHTDSDGDDASNLDLSKRRGLSVKNELVTKFSCDAARIETDGKGESEPIADNNSSVNKAKNRRVEFVNLKSSEATAPPVKGPATQKNGPLTDSDGNSYKIVTIGSQIWMAENLKTTKYNDGTSIPLVADSVKWPYIETAAYCWFYNNESKYKNTYGALYNWYAVNTGKLCPSGWRLPTMTELTKLEEYLGESDVADRKIRETGTTHWKSPGTKATNETGFTALPGGERDNFGSFSNFGREATVGMSGSWWSSTEDLTQSVPPTPGPPSNAYNMSLKWDYQGVFLGTYPKEYGFSVRCIKD
jgi:OmpA-OmpF porin, OOP family